MEYGKDFEKDMAINRFQLELECERHPGLYAFYTVYGNKAEKKYAKLALKFKYLIGEIEINLRRNPPSDIKITESSIKALLMADEGIQKMEEDLLDLKLELNIYKSALTALEHRRSELNNLVSLYQSSYFSKPSGQKKENNIDVAQREQRKNIKRRNKDE